MGGKARRAAQWRLPSSTWELKGQGAPQWLWGSRPSEPSRGLAPRSSAGPLALRRPCASQCACPARPRPAPPPIVPCSRLPTARSHHRVGGRSLPGSHAPAGLPWEGSGSRACTFHTAAPSPVEAVQGGAWEKRGSRATPCVTVIGPAGTDRGPGGGGRPGLPGPACPLLERGATGTRGRAGVSGACRASLSAGGSGVSSRCPEGGGAQSGSKGFPPCLHTGPQSANHLPRPQLPGPSPGARASAHGSGDTSVGSLSPLWEAGG